MSTLLETGVKRAKGRQQYEKIKNGEILSVLNHLKSYCYGCCQGYVDGIVDCENKDCELYAYMPYGQIVKNKKKKERSQKQLVYDKLLRDRLKKSNPCS